MFQDKFPSNSEGPPIHRTNKIKRPNQPTKLRPGRFERPPFWKRDGRLTRAPDRTSQLESDALPLRHGPVDNRSLIVDNYPRIVLGRSSVAEVLGSCLELTTMVSVTVSAARKTPLARDLPVTLEFPEKTADAVTIADVKAAFAAKYPKVPLVLLATHTFRSLPS